MNTPLNAHSDVAVSAAAHESFSFSEHGPANAPIVPDAHLLFSGAYERSGHDLIISDSNHRITIHDYFLGEKRSPLISADGALLDARVVDTLTGYQTFAQAAGNASSAAKLIGHVATVTGSASIVRNGVTIEANNGDVIYQNDVVQTGSDSKIGLVLIDGSAFNLSANARFMLNDLGYEDQTNANGTLVSLTTGSNHSLFTLVQGAASFVAGQVAKTGDMKVATPTAVIGIRGTAVILNVDSVDGQVSISVADQHDGQIHSVQVFRCVPGSALQGACIAGDAIGIVSSDGPSLTITPTANFEVTTQAVGKSQSQVAQEFGAFQQVLTTYDIGRQIAPDTPPPSDGKRGDVDTKSLQKFAGSPPPLPTEAPTAVVVDDVKGQASGGSITPPTVTLALITASSGSTTKSPVATLDTTQVVTVVPSGPVTINTAGGQTNQGTQTISGSVDLVYVGTTVTLYDTYNGVTTQIGVATVGSDGVWSKAVTLVGDGDHSIVALDANSNVTASVPVVFTLDTTAPTVAITSTGGPTNQASQTITGTVDAADAGATVTILDGATAIGTALVQSNGSWSSAVTLSNGANSLTARVSDTAGNTATSSAVVYTLSTTGPTVTEALASDTGASSTDHITSSPALTGTGIASTLVHFTIDGIASPTTGTSDAQGAWSFTPSGLADGAHTIVASQTDAFGNTGSASLSFTLDTTAPTVAITSTGGPTNQASQTITGTVDAADAGATVTILDGATAIGTALVQSNGSWSSAVTLSNGANSLTARVSDTAGNTATSSAVVYTLSTTGPTVTEALASDTGASSTDHITSSPALTGTGIASTLVHFTIDGIASPTTGTSDAQGAWSFTPSGLADGAHTIVASQTDAFGNTGSASLSFTLDTTSPTEALAFRSIANSGVANSLTISGTNALLAAGEKIQVSSDGGASWADVLQNSPTIWSLVDGTTHPSHFTYQARIIDTAGNIGTVVDQPINGESSSAVVVGNLDPTNSSNVTVAVPGSPPILGAYNGVQAFTFGSGNVVVSTASGASITGTKQYGIETFSASTGSVSVTTAANSDVRSGSAGILAYNQAALISQLNGVTTSSILVTANGTIESGTTPTGSGARPAGILAGYKGGTTNTVNPAVFGNVIVDNFATVTAAGGDGVRAFNYGSGNVSVIDRAGSTISAADVFGISAVTYGIGQVLVNMEAGATINSGSSGVQAINLAATIGVAAASTVSVTSRGTIHSGTHLTPGGSQPQGISAGYYSNGGVSDTNVNGTVLVDNFANVTADAGTGVNAYNWGNGAVALVNEANTNVWGAQYGLTAYSLSSGTGSSGSVTISVGQNATITAGALYGIIAIDAAERNGGNISVTTSVGDIINSGGSGISASNQALGTVSNPITGQVSVTAFGTINSAYDMFTGGGQPGGIWGGYSGGGNQTVNTFVHGNVIVDSGATINAAAGVGIGLYNFGTGTISATLEQSSAINAISAGLNIFAQGGGNVTIVNHGGLTVPTGTGIVAGSGQPSTGGSGVISISNLHDVGGPASSGLIVALGSLSNATIQVYNWSNQDAAIANSGTITATQFSSTRLNTAIGTYNGPTSTNVGSAIVNNSGVVTGNVSFGAAFNITAASFNNNAGGVWNVNGQNYFGGVTNAINNAGTINASGLSIFSSSGPLAVSNTGAVNVLAFGAALVLGNVSGQGTFTIGDHAALEFGGSVAGGSTGQTISFVNGNGLLTLDSPAAFNGTIAGLSIGDTLDFLGGVVVSSASISGTTLTVTDSAHSQTYSYQVAGAASGTAFNLLSADKIVMIPVSALFPTSAQRSFTPSSGSFYVLANDTISGTGVGFAVNSTDSSSLDYTTVQINQNSSISVSGTGVNLTTTGANIALVNAGNITSTAGAGILTNSGSGSTDIVNYGSISGQTVGIGARTSGAGALNIVAGGAITGTTSIGISAISTLGAVNITTTTGLLINAGTGGIVAQNQGTSVPAGSSSISISTSSGTINAGTTAISASYLLGTSAPSTPPNPPNATVYGDISIENGATLNAAAGVGISASNYGVGNILVSNNATITATAAGTTIPGTTSSQYGISAFNYGSGKSIVTTGYGSLINSGSTGINVSNQATAIAAAAASTVTVVALGSINSGANNNNSGSAPSGIQAGFNPGLASVFNAGVWGDVLVSANGNIAAAAGDGINAYNYGNGSVTVNVAPSVNIQALTSATSTSGKAPYGISASVYGPGDIAVTTAGGDVVTSGSSGISATNLATSIGASEAALITVYNLAAIHSGSIVTNSGSQPSGIAAGFFGGTSATANLSVNGRVIVNNDGNIVSDAGVGINAYHYGNGDITINDASGTTVSGAQYGIEAHAEATGSTGNIAVNVYAGASITSTTSYGIFAYTKGSGNISIITTSGDVINAGSVGINATNEAASIDPSANSSIVVTAAGTINSGTGSTGTGNPPAGIIAGYLGGTAIPSSFPLTALDGDVTVNSTANIVAAAGDGIRAYTYGIGDITVNDLAGSITALGGSSPTNGFGVGISANNFGSGNISISTAAGNVINSGSSGIAAVNKAPSSGPFVVPSTSVISVSSYGTIFSGTVLTGAGDAPAGILASYNPNSANVADDSVHGNIQVDDYGSIFAAAGTDGIRGENYGTGAVTITAEAGALISGGRYGISAVSHDGGNVVVTNYADATGTTAAVNAMTTAAGTAVVDNYGHLVGGISAYNATVTNELLAGWSVNGTSTFSGVSVLMNMGSIDSVGSSLISGLSSFVNTGTIEALSGSLEIANAMTGAGIVNIYGATVQLDAASDAHVQFVSSQPGKLVLADPVHFAGTVSGFDAGDILDLKGIAPASVSISASGSLHVSYSGGAIDLRGAYSASDFSVVSDGAGGSEISWNHHAPAIDTHQISIVNKPNGTTAVLGLQITDTDTNASTESFTLSATTLDAQSGSSVAPSGSVGSLTAINSVLAAGAIYNPGASPPQSDKIALTVTDGFGAIDTVNLVFNATGTSANTVLQGTSGRDVVFASNGSDMLVGGGGPDQFVFAPTSLTGVAQHTVTDFIVGLDRLDVRQFASLSATSAPTETQQGSDTLVTLDSHDIILLKNVNVTTLQTSDFLFHA
ncbi:MULTISPECIES: Ig-like domain-containing protein [Bradyrhizobium]|uniref:Ig-like domain-containing protein n=1 Tax=Bradyrhizobium TaxID=374 RepID=UPI001EDB82EF|nr:Ig-like domain-containing protein [Bradyrhizobium zhengyangense]MCG2645685.1 Ig-like domain-containing protein [Bradyrhizobium zhengyangense]